MTTITAHAGALRTEPNTKESLRTCMEFVGQDIVEVDLRFSPEGTPVLSHDAPRPDACTLEESFEIAREYPAQFNLDLKEAAGNLAAVRTLLERYGMAERAFFTGLRSAKDVKAVGGCGIPWYLNTYLPRFPFAAGIMALRAKALGAAGLNMPYKRCGKAVMRAARRMGLLVSVWTVDEPEAMARMLRLGVDNITTRRPELLREVMDTLLK